MNYNKSQQKAISHKDGPMLVLAGPGSGKTAVITERTVNLIEKYGVNPSNILVITFTRAAAQEMRQRFLAKTKSNKSRVTFGTFHSVFFMVLKYAYHFENGNIVTEEQRYGFMREILSHYHLEYQEESELIAGILAEIGKIKNERIPLERFYSSHCGEEVFRSVYQNYEERLKGNRLIDFDDMLVYTYDLFSQRKDILSAWQKKYRYILIDEFQDINPIQWDIMKMLGGQEGNLFIVGDDDQSIYRFRGSKPEIMLGFKKDYPTAVQVTLDTNYRCSKTIVEAAGKLIVHNKKRYRKNLTAEREEKSPVVCRLFEDSQKENAYIAGQIKKAQEEGIPFSETAVLFRTNTQPGFLMEQLMSANIPFRAKDKIPDLYEHWIAKDIFTYIRIAQGSRSRADFLSVMNKPKRYIGRDSLYAQEISFEEWMKMYGDKPWIAERIEKFQYDMKHLSRLSPYAAVNYIRRGIGYDDYLKEFADYKNTSKEEFYEIADEIQSSAKTKKTFKEWSDHIEAYQAGLKEQAKRNSADTDAVTLATLHSAKGLEFKQVYLLDVNEGVMPYKKAVLEADLEEERRLFYVGLTRAKDRLELCCVKTLRNKKTEPSRFIEEAGLVLT